MAFTILIPLPFSQRLIRPMAEMGGDQGEGENPRVFSSSPPSLVLPTPPKADQPLAERGRKLIVCLNLLRSYNYTHHITDFYKE